MVKRLLVCSLASAVLLLAVSIYYVTWGIEELPEIGSKEYNEMMAPFLDGETANLTDDIYKHLYEDTYETDSPKDDQETDGDETTKGDGQRTVAGQTCDEDCLQFRMQLDAWPPDKPKAIIYYLVYRRYAMRSLRKSIRQLHQNFNSRFRYPIVVFVKDNIDNFDDRWRIQNTIQGDDETPSPSIYVQPVRFRIPNFVNASRALLGPESRQIIDACRFHASAVYDQPIVRSAGLEYVWRLDIDEAFIQHPIDYDLFREMRDGGYQYGYWRIDTGWSSVDHSLWDAVDRYVNATPTVTPTFYRQWPRNAARYTTKFDLSDLNVWTSPQYRHYFNHVDRLGGIYYHKWSESAIKTIGVTLFVPRTHTHLFSGNATKRSPVNDTDNDLKRHVSRQTSQNLR